MTERTALYEAHLEAGARIVDFGGWDMPLHYGSQIDEHHAVRRSAGVFDVSHMTVVDIGGAGAREYLSVLLANDVGKLSQPGRGLYSCMLNETGGIIDDLIAYRSDAGYRLIVNAATRNRDLEWIRAVAGGRDVSVREWKDKIMLAVQGPQAVEAVAAQLPADSGIDRLAPFGCVETGGLFIARTGYTGEDGVEVVGAVLQGLDLWHGLVTAGIQPCGLGARDTLRLEAGLNLYGQDMDETTSPLVSGLAWTVALEPAGRDFIGRPAVEAEARAGPHEDFVGLILEDRGIMRHGQRVVTDGGDGAVTSGGFSPTLEASIALARVPPGTGDACEVEIRNDLRRARVVAPPFVRRGRVLVQ